MRKPILMIAIVCAALAVCGGVRAKGAAVPVYVDGRQVRLKPPAMIRDGKAYVSLRAVADVLEATTKYDAKTQTATVTVGNKRTRVKQSDGVTVNGVLFLPLRATGEALGCTVHWNQTERAVRIEKEEACPTGGG